LEGIVDNGKNESELRERKLQASSAIRAAKNAENPELIATAENVIRGVLRSYGLTTMTSTAKELSSLLR
jgi:hypothetical protein